MMNIENFHLLSLIYTRDVTNLEYFLADVQNVKRLKRRALRLGGWKLLDSLERGILSTVCNVLTTVRSELLRKVLVRIVVKISDYLMDRFEKTLIENYLKLKELISTKMIPKLATTINKLTDEEYLINQAWQLTVSASVGMDCPPLD